MCYCGFKCGVLSIAYRCPMARNVCGSDLFLASSGFMVDISHISFEP